MESFSAQDWILIITAIGFVLNNVITNWRQSVKIDTVVSTAKVIEGHVNSAATLARAEREAGIAREAALQLTINDLRSSAALLAQAAASSTTSVTPKLTK